MPNLKPLLRHCVWFAFMLPIGILSSNVLRGQDSQPADSAKTKESNAPELSVKQGQLADRFKRLEQVIGRLAELSAGSDPRRAELLRQAIAQSREQDISVRFEAIVKLLEDERLSAATTNQTELQKELEALLNLLLKADRDTALASERERVRAYLKELNRLMRLERDLRARTEGGDDAKRLTESQQRVAEETGKLGGQIAENEREEFPDTKSGDKANDKKPADGKVEDASGKNSKSSDAKSGETKPKSGGEKSGDSSNPESKKSKGAEGKSAPDSSSKGDNQPNEGGAKQSAGGEGQSGESKSGQGANEDSPPASQRPADRATEQLRKAQQQMEEAIKKLEEASRDGATEHQQIAIESLEVAKAELERVLRQLREEELERTLTQLAARFRKMLELQTAIYDGTMRLDKVAATDRGQDHEIEAARLSRQESSLEREADKALLLLREEGSSVAFPETIELLRDDMRQVTQRLSKVDVGALTQGLETDIIAALEETISALEKALKDLEQNRTPPGGGAPSGAQPSEPPLVDVIAELKMIRALQMRINVRTARYGKMITGEHANQPEIVSALQDLAERQERVHEATAELSRRQNN
jgi:hypothetical protein